MLTFASILAGFPAFELLALRHGAELRPGFDERPLRAARRDI